MAENVTQMKETELFVSPLQPAPQFEAHPIHRKVLAEKLARGEASLDGKGRAVQAFDTEPIIEENTKQLKTLQFQLGMLVSSGVEHQLINRFKGSYEPVDIVEGTFRMYKIAIRKLLSPLKLFIHYRGGVTEDTIETVGLAPDKNRKP